jgi:cytochrome c2
MTRLSPAVSARPHFTVVMAALVAATAVTWRVLSPHALAVLTTPQCKLSVEALRGRRWAKTCAGCHYLGVHPPANIDSYNGPDIHDIYMSPAGTKSLAYGHKYRPPLVTARKAGIIWNDENLNAYLKGPESFLKSATGVSFNDFEYMPFWIGTDSVAAIRDRNDAIAFLREIKDRPCECAVPRLDDNSCGPS